MLERNIKKKQVWKLVSIWKYWRWSRKGEIMEICSLINRLIQYALKNSLITEDDVMFVRNELMALLHLKDWQDIKEDYQIPEYPQEILDKICDYAVEKKIIEMGLQIEIFLILKLWENSLLFQEKL